MGQELGNNALNLNTQAPRRFGLIKDALLPRLHGNKCSEEMKDEFRHPPEPSVFDPPLSSCGSETGSEDQKPGNASAGPSEHDSVTSRKRGSQSDVAPERKRCRLAGLDDTEESGYDPMQSEIPLSTFLNESRGDTGKSKPGLASHYDSDVPFRSYSSSHHKNKYKSISKPGTSHAHQHSPRSRKQSKESTSASSSQGAGFKEPDGTALQALKALDRRKEGVDAKALSTFRTPAIVEISSPDDKILRRSIRNRQASNQASTPEQSPQRSRTQNSFKIPAPNPLAPTFRAPVSPRELIDVAPSEGVKIAKTGLKTLGVDIIVDNSNVPSSGHSVLSDIPDDASDSSSLSMAPSSTQLEAERLIQGHSESPTAVSHAELERSSDPPMQLCLACKVPVSEEIWQQFQSEHHLVVSDGRIPWKLQKLFCKMHVAYAARDEWIERGYPEIDWNYLPRRIERHETTIEGILVGKRQSYYRKALEKKVKSGRKITFVRSLASSDEAGDCQTGYYGSRGAKLMMEKLAEAFSVLLRDLDVSDKLISAGGGVSAYVQAVLVPELATVLIKEDMGVDDEKAREIIKESAILGELMNEEEADVVDEEKLERKRLQDEEERRQERATRRELERREQQAAEW